MCTLQIDLPFMWLPLNSQRVGLNWVHHPICARWPGGLTRFISAAVINKINFNWPSLIYAIMLVGPPLSTYTQNETIASYRVPKDG